MKRVLGLSSIPIDEGLGAGAERISQLYRHLPPRFEKTLVALCGLRGSRGERRLAGNVLEILVPSPVQTAFFYLEALRIAPFFRVASAHALYAGPAEKRLREGFDIVQFDSLWITPWMRRVPEGTPIVYASHNFETAWYEGEIRRFPFPRSHARALADLERRAVHRADRVLAVTEEDRDQFVSALGAEREKIAVVPNGFDDERFAPVSVEEKKEERRRLGLPLDGRIALFAGSNVAPNRDAVESILREIAPKAPPAFLFLVAGKVGTAYAGRGGERVRFTGPVSDIVPYFRAADIGLNPVRFGSGSNIKVLQYLGSGLPVLSTEFGMRGFDDLRPHVTVARLDRFHYHLERTGTDETSVRLAREKYGWRCASSRLAAVYADLLGEGGPFPADATSPARRPGGES
jgi:glycosyltransferase involved in cell wall biosynthesis